MILIDTTYFVRELFVPHAKAKPSSVEGVAAAAMHKTNSTDLEDFILKYEYQYLVNVLGRSFADYFIEHKDDEEFASLRSLLANSTRKVSPIANYVYVMWARNNQTQTTNVGGEVIGQLDYAKNVSEALKQIDIWNEMVLMNREIYNLANDSGLLDEYGDSCDKMQDSMFRTWNNLGL